MNKLINKKTNKIIATLLIISLILISTSCAPKKSLISAQISDDKETFTSTQALNDNNTTTDISSSISDNKNDIIDIDASTNTLSNSDNIDGENQDKKRIEADSSTDEKWTTEKIYVDFTAPYATYSIINNGYAVLYKLKKNKTTNYKNKTIAVNAGHGTKGGETIKTFAHPDFSPKVTGGANAEGSILASAVSSGMTFINGMTEANANLVVAYLLKDKLLDSGYSVLMIRENDDCRLDNIARTVIANENSDAHIAIHFDSTRSDKGIFYIVPYNNQSYLDMEPLKSNAKNIKALGNSVIKAFKEMGEKVWKDSGTLQGDLTQLSFSTNASIDIELGDRATELTKEKAETFAEGIKRGIDLYFEVEK